MAKTSKHLPSEVMFNAYPDSCQEKLTGMVKLLGKADIKDSFSLFYILPSLFQSDLDRGFCVVSYDINEELASKESLDQLQELGISLKLDFVLNHLSVQSPQFLDLLKNGENSVHKDTFIDWNKFWEGNGTMGPEGYMIPHEEHLNKLFMRKPELPILKVPFQDGSYRFYWNTFYQNTTFTNVLAGQLATIEGVSKKSAQELADLINRAVDCGKDVYKLDFAHNSKLKPSVINYLERNCCEYLGQMDLNPKSGQVWQFYRETLKKLSEYGAKIVRLDAFAYLHKEVGLSNFFNEPGTWEYLARIKEIADEYDLVLLPEIHSKYEDKIHEKLAEHGYPIYDFFFPGLVIHALEYADNGYLLKWINEIVEKKYQVVNMLGCHDGIPVLDVKGLLNDETVDDLIEIIKGRGGRVKNLFGPDGKKISYYQVNATFYSALDENDRKFLLARAIQIFMPGTPQIWYLDLFVGTNNYEAADKVGHKEINRTNLSEKDIEDALTKRIVQEQLKLLKFRNKTPAFGQDAVLTIAKTDSDKLDLTWTNKRDTVNLKANLKNMDFEITHNDNEVMKFCGNDKL